MEAFGARGVSSEAMRTLWLVALVASTAAADSVTDRLSKMTIKELRHLARNLGADDELPRMPIEKMEVVRALAPAVRDAEARERSKAYGWWLWNGLYYGGVAAVLWVFAAPLLMATAEGRGAFRREFEERRALAEYAYRKGSWDAAALVAATGLIDFATWYLRVSVLVSWITPRDSFLRRYLNPLPSIGIDPAAAVGQSSGFSVNVAPMLAIWCLGYAKAKCGAAVGRRMQARAERRREERATRKKRQ